MRISPQEVIVENTSEMEVGVEHLVTRFRNAPHAERMALRNSWKLTTAQWVEVYREARGLPGLKTFAAQKAIETAQTASDLIHIIPELNGKGHRSLALEELRRFRHLTHEELDLMRMPGSRSLILDSIAWYLEGPDDGKHRN